MHVTRHYLVETRSARLIGIQRGSVGQFDACDLARCEPSGKLDHGNLSGASVRSMTEDERERARIVGTYDRHSEVAPGAIQGIAQQQAMGYAVERLAYLATLPQHLPTGPACIEPVKRGFKPGPAKEHKPRASKRIERAVKAEKARVESEYDRLLREARAGLDLTNPRHVQRFEARLERAREAAASKASLNAYIETERSCGRAT